MVARVLLGCYELLLCGCYSVLSGCQGVINCCYVDARVF